MHVQICELPSRFYTCLERIYNVEFSVFLGSKQMSFDACLGENDDKHANKLLYLNSKNM